MSGQGRGRGRGGSGRGGSSQGGPGRGGSGPGKGGPGGPKNKDQKKQPNHRASQSMNNLSTKQNPPQFGKRGGPHIRGGIQRGGPNIRGGIQRGGQHHYHRDMFNPSHPPQYQNAQYGPPPPPPQLMEMPPPYSDIRPSYPLQYDPGFTGGYKMCQSPPPSYDEVGSVGKKKVASEKLKVETVVKTLALFAGQFATAEIIGKHVDQDSKAVENVAKSNSNIFASMHNGKEVLIELVPKTGICMEYLSDEGCGSPSNCKNLHICKYFVLASCNSGFGCQFGHRWDTSHNNRILSKMYLDVIDKYVLQQVMKKVCKGCLPPQICSHYNSKNGCKYEEKCGKLHICRNFIMTSGKCSNNDCSYSHDIVTSQNKRILKKHNISVNESPRDIIMTLKGLLEKEGDEANIKDGRKNKDPTGNQEGRKGKVNVESENSSDSNSSDDSTDRKSKGDKAKAKIKTKGERASEGNAQDKPARNKTFRSTDIFGDVEIPEICVFSIEDKCRNDKKGCNYLHSKSLFHWQFENNKHWYNFRIFQSKILENGYRDVNKGTMTIAPLNPKKVEEYAKQLLSILGTDTWTADYQNMVMKKSSGSEQLKIRRISTKSAAESASPKATVFEWYFADEQGKWIRYGQADSLGKQQYVCTVTCEEIEKQYISDPSSFLEISNSKFKYKLDFSKMSQQNLTTGKEREIRRRPSRLSYQKRSESDSEAALPTYWSAMTSQQTHVLHFLDSSSSEYKEVNMLLKMSLPTLNIVKIQRLQNPYLWRLLQYKKADLSRRLDENELNMQKLFHAVDPANIDTVCKENFDWRQGTTMKQEFGKGTYFSNRAAVTRKDCAPDDRGHLFIFVAQVIIGTVTKGSPELTRPPMNPISNTLYDTTVDDIHNTTVFVKYDKEDYYPEYLVEFY